MKNLQYRTVYNIANLIGASFVGVGFGLIDISYGFISFGLLFLVINIYNSIVVKAN